MLRIGVLLPPKIKSPFFFLFFILLFVGPEILIHPCHCILGDDTAWVCHIFLGFWEYVIIDTPTEWPLQLFGPL